MARNICCYYSQESVSIKSKASSILVKAYGENLSTQSLHDSSNDSATALTLASFFLKLDDPALAAELERFREKYEKRFGEADITRRWTSTLPERERQWLIVHHPRRYWSGLPPFLRAYLRQKMSDARAIGRLDDAPDTFLRMYATGTMEIDPELPNR